MSMKVTEKWIAAGAVAGVALDAVAVSCGLSGITTVKTAGMLCDISVAIVLAPMLVAFAVSFFPERSAA